MKRSTLLQLAFTAVGVVAFGVLLTVARLRFSESHATNLLGVLQDAKPAEDQQPQKTAGDTYRNPSDYVAPMYCCPVLQSGQACGLFDSAQTQKCGVQNKNGEFDPGEEFQPTEAGLDACANACAAR